MTDQAVATKPKRAPQSRFPVDVIARGLAALAYHAGNGRKAAADLREEGISIDHTTLCKWKNKLHVEEYERIRDEIMPKVRQQAGDEHLELAARQMDVNRKILERLGKEVDELPIKELPGASRNMSVGAAVETEKAQLLHEQPTERKAIDLPSAIKELKSLGVEPEVVIDAQVVEESDA